MLVISTEQEMARAVGSPLEPELKLCLRSHWERLSKYEGYSLTELALFIVVQPADTLADVECASARRLVQVDGGVARFTQLPEVVEQHVGWFELIFILSDDGYGLVLFLEIAKGTDDLLTAACLDALRQLQ